MPVYALSGAMLSRWYALIGGITVYHSQDMVPVAVYLNVPFSYTTDDIHM